VYRSSTWLQGYKYFTRVHVFRSGPGCNTGHHMSRSNKVYRGTGAVLCYRGTGIVQIYIGTGVIQW